jgi:hypothetical protein
MQRRTADSHRVRIDGFETKYTVAASSERVEFGLEFFAEFNLELARGTERLEWISFPAS